MEQLSQSERFLSSHSNFSAPAASSFSHPSRAETETTKSQEDDHAQNQRETKIVGDEILNPGPLDSDGELHSTPLPMDQLNKLALSKPSASAGEDKIDLGVIKAPKKKKKRKKFKGV